MCIMLYTSHLLGQCLGSSFYLSEDSFLFALGHLVCHCALCAIDYRLTSTRFLLELCSDIEQKRSREGRGTSNMYLRILASPAGHHAQLHLLCMTLPWAVHQAHTLMPCFSSDTQRTLHRQSTPHPSHLLSLLRFYLPDQSDSPPSHRIMSRLLLTLHPPLQPPIKHNKSAA